MARRLRIATFNCENLFSRPEIFAGTWERNNELLGYVAELREELAKRTFDHAEIKKLKRKLKGYVTVNDIRGKHTSATGAGKWLGWIEFTRRPAREAAVDNVARVITEVNADVMCLVEVENRPTLERFHDAHLYKRFLKRAKRAPYEHIMCIDGNDGRGIDVAVMSRRPIEWMRSHVDDETTYNGNRIKTFSRDCLRVQISLRGGKTLHLMANHLKSMGYSPGNDPLSERRRRGQAARVAKLLDEHDLDSEWVVVAGDLNTDPEKRSLRPLTRKADIYNVNLKLDPDERGTYRTGKKQLDYIFVSTALRRKLHRVRIERKGVYSTKHEHFPQVEDRRTEASDHAVVVAEFRY